MGCQPATVTPGELVEFGEELIRGRRVEDAEGSQTVWSYQRR